MSGTGTKPAARAPLTRERILRTALELADAQAIGSLTMRDLGHALGFEAMALYRHVANKDEILDGILDMVLSEIEAPAPSGDWEESIRRSAISVHDVLTRHTWAATLMTTPQRLRPPWLDFMEALLAR